MSLTLRKVNPGDIESLNSIRKGESPKLHNERLQEQAEGKSVYLIAFQDENPVGHVYVKLNGSEKHHDSPILQDLYVSEDFREKGIGTKIIEETEKFLKELGYAEVGLDVEVEERWIRKFYEEQEFKNGSGPHKQSWIDKDSGEKIEMEVVHLKKELK